MEENAEGTPLARIDAPASAGVPPTGEAIPR